MDYDSSEDMIQRLASGKCVPCKDTKPFGSEEIWERLKVLPGWLPSANSIWKEFRFKSYLRGLEFACSFGRIAESENHHPDMLVGWQRVKVSLSTHAIKGLSQNDFIMAARAELTYRTMVQKS